MFSFAGNPAFFIIMEVNQKCKKKAVRLEDAGCFLLEFQMIDAISFMHLIS